MSLFKKKFPTKAKVEESKDVPIYNASAKLTDPHSDYDVAQDVQINDIKKRMLTEDDVRRIVMDELKKLLSDGGVENEIAMKILNQNKSVSTIEEEEKNKYPERIPFPTRMMDADDVLKDCYNELKAEALAYGLKSRLSNSGDTFRLHTKTYMKITIAGNYLKCYFSLKPESYADSGIPVIDAGIKHIYKDIPLAFKVRSPLSLRRAKQLLSDACRRDNITIGDVTPRDWVTPLKDFEPQLGKKEDD